MADAHLAEVGKLANTYLQQDEAAMRQSSTVRAATDALQNAQYWLQRDPHNAELQSQCRQLQRDLYKAQDSFHRARREAALEKERSEKAEIVAQAEARRAAEIEAEAKEHHLQSWLAVGGLRASHESAWPRLWEEELEHRRAANDAQLYRSIELRSESAPRAAPARPAPAAPEMVMVEAVPDRMPPPSRARGRRPPPVQEEATVSAHVEAPSTPDRPVSVHYGQIGE